MMLAILARRASRSEVPPPEPSVAERRVTEDGNVRVTEDTTRIYEPGVYEPEVYFDGIPDVRYTEGVLGVEEPPPPPGVVTLGSHTTILQAFATGGHTSGSGSHTAGTGSNRCLVVVFKMMPSQLNTALTAVTYGGQALTQLVPLSSSATFNRPGVSIWYLLSPPTGANTLAWTSNQAYDAVAATAIDLTGVDPGNPTGATGSNSNPIVALGAFHDLNTEALNSLVIGGISVKGTFKGPFTPDVNTAEITDAVTGQSGPNDACVFVGYRQAGQPGVHRIGASWAQESGWAIAVAEFIPA